MISCFHSAAQSEAPGGVSGSEGKHQGAACWLRLPQGLQEVPQQVTQLTFNPGSRVWLAMRLMDYEDL